MISFNQFFNDNTKEKIAIMPGAYKPPHKGHFNAYENLLDNADKGIIPVSKSSRDEITGEQSKAIWEIYKRYYKKPVDVVLCDKSPVTAMYDFINGNKDKNIFVGVGEKANDNDRFKWLEKRIDEFPNVAIMELSLECEGISGTDVRKRIQDRDPSVIDFFVPDIVVGTDRSEIARILAINK